MDSTAKNRDILLLNQDEKFLKIIQKLLVKAGYAVHMSMFLQKALLRLSTEPIGLIICDVALKDATAAQFLELLKKDPSLKSIPFVFYVSLENQKYLKPVQAIQLQAADYMVYPMDENDFIKRIGEIMPPDQEEEEVYLQLEKEPPAGSIPEPSLTEESAEEWRTDKMFDLLAPTSVFISRNNQDWRPSQLVNLTNAQGLVEAPFPSKAGETIKIKCRLPEGEVISSGKLIHVISGDKEKQAGFLIDFCEDPQWNQIYEYLKPVENAALSQPEPDPAPAPISNKTDETAQGPPPVPAGKNGLSEKIPLKEPERPSPVLIKVQVSKDGLFWMPGHIMHAGKKSVLLATAILAKKGDTIHLKYFAPKGAMTTTGEVKKITLDDFQRPAAMQIHFSKDAEWRTLADYLVSAQKSPSLKNINGSSAKSLTNQPITRGSSGRNTAEESAEKTLVNTLVKKERSIKNVFYQSLIGKQLDNFVISSFIHAGGMGAVFKGWDTALERNVALKVISYDLSSQKKFVDMFFNEARFASKLNHPNIAQIYYIGKANDILYFVMEFVQGRTFRELIEKRVPLTLKKKIRYFKTVCIALDFVWQQKIIHRDIKPENIIVNHQDIAKIVDFGVAKQYKDEKAPKRPKLIGSPRYLSPEVILGQAVDQRSDIYSLGATCYYLLTDHPPFNGKSLDVVLHKHVNEKVVPLYKLKPDIPEPLSQIIEKMLAKNPEERYQNYMAIIRDLEKHSHLWKN